MPRIVHCSITGPQACSVTRAESWKDYWTVKEAPHCVLLFLQFTRFHHFNSLYALKSLPLGLELSPHSLFALQMLFQGSQVLVAQLMCPDEDDVSQVSRHITVVQKLCRYKAPHDALHPQYRTTCITSRPMCPEFQIYAKTTLPVQCHLLSFSVCQFCLAGHRHCNMSRPD